VSNLPLFRTSDSAYSPHHWKYLRHFIAHYGGLEVDGELAGQVSIKLEKDKRKRRLSR
jgi:hypothetical protein